MISALINLSTNIVENMIVADPAIDPAPDGYLLIGSPPNYVNIGTVWDGTGFIDPHPARQPAVIAGLKTL